MKKKLTVTIGIPVFNEGKNIKNLLDSLIRQKTRGFSLEKILIAYDGSSDDTFEIVKNFSKNHQLIQLVKCGQSSKRAKLNYFYKVNTSDILAVFDGDVVLGSTNTVFELCRAFRSTDVGLVGGFNIPLKPINFFERAVVEWINLWNDIRVNYKQGNNIHNHLGCVSAIRKDLARQTIIPKQIVADDDFLFFYAIKKGYKFQFAKQAIVYYRNVNNLRDFLKQHSRLLNGKVGIAKYFGNWVFEYYSIGTKYKIEMLVKSFIKHPFILTASVLLQIVLRISIFINKGKEKSDWSAVLSSKNVRYVL